jgi:hypothetical protein
MGLLHVPAVQTQTATLLQQCRNNRDCQPYPCHFFYLFAVLSSLRVQEIAIDTGQRPTNLAQISATDIVCSADRIRYSRDCLDAGGEFRRLISPHPQAVACYEASCRNS